MGMVWFECCAVLFYFLILLPLVLDEDLDLDKGDIGHDKEVLEHE